MGDPIIQELHWHRLEHTRKFNFDLVAICEDLCTMQREQGLKVVRLPAKRLERRERAPRERT